ncbi:unnamed protein product [Adineta ricciae]|uniref:Uncharacterized protein n=1 Tax=Adineta ricciae TaxID=249248 RepID=A0A815F734_ADIRI|nr:unnamed protein product [Adineta ricciae]
MFRIRHGIRDRRNPMGSVYGIVRPGTLEPTENVPVPEQMALQLEALQKENRQLKQTLNLRNVEKLETKEEIKDLKSEISQLKNLISNVNCRCSAFEKKHGEYKQNMKAAFGQVELALTQLQNSLKNFQRTMET